MPRRPRLDAAGIAQHVIQRGNDRQPCFFADVDRLRYLRDLNELAMAHDCAVHGYVLMTNHVHLLMSPGALGAISALMHTLGTRYVRAINDRYGRTGTLWEGRYKSCLVDSEQYVLTCLRYIELNPVRAGIVQEPARYPWSSYRANGEGRADPLVRAHPAYLALAPDTAARLTRYRELVAAGIEEAELSAIRGYTQRQQALGSSSFQDAIEAILGRRARPGRNGRPPAAPLKAASLPPPSPGTRDNAAERLGKL